MGKLVFHIYWIVVTSGIKLLIVFSIKYRKMGLDKPVLKI